MSGLLVARRYPSAYGCLPEGWARAPGRVTLLMGACMFLFAVIYLCGADDHVAVGTDPVRARCKSKVGRLMAVGE